MAEIRVITHREVSLSDDEYWIVAHALEHYRDFFYRLSDADQETYERIGKLYQDWVADK